MYIDLQGNGVETKTVGNERSDCEIDCECTMRFYDFNDKSDAQASIDIEAEIKTFESFLSIDGLSPPRTGDAEKAMAKEKADCGRKKRNYTAYEHIN
jgi:hypothetical protein